MDYNTLRTFADSWGLLGMAVFFVAAIFWAFRPGSKEIADSAKAIPFKDDSHD